VEESVGEPIYYLQGNLSAPPFLAGAPVNPSRPAIEAVLTIDHPPCLSIWDLVFQIKSYGFQIDSDDAIKVSLDALARVAELPSMPALLNA
jgi:hypothetical protein